MMLPISHRLRCWPRNPNSHAWSRFVQVDWLYKGKLNARSHILIAPTNLPHCLTTTHFLPLSPRGQQAEPPVLMTQLVFPTLHCGWGGCSEAVRWGVTPGRSAGVYLQSPWPLCGMSGVFKGSWVLRPREAEAWSLVPMRVRRRSDLRLATLLPGIGGLLSIL